QGHGRDAEEVRQAGRHAQLPGTAPPTGLDPNSDAGFKELEQALKDEDPGVRIMAATKLARVSSSRTDAAMKALGSLADDKDADVRSQMHHSLAGLTPKPSRSSGR